MGGSTARSHAHCAAVLPPLLLRQQLLGEQLLSAVVTALTRNRVHTTHRVSGTVSAVLGEAGECVPLDTAITSMERCTAPRLVDCVLLLLYLLLRLAVVIVRIRRRVQATLRLVGMLCASR